ncbi:MAG TPA: hypothetical protein VJQ47_13880 [Steroidobacteraceae bacterium]|nr:hypothetical protein [Steroidobacteraceae bacterium]
MTGKPRIDWVALVLSIAALVISALQWYETRRGGQLASAAALAFQIDTELATHHYGFGVKNAGPGVARIRDVMFYVDGKPVDDLTPAEEAAGLDSARDFGVDLEHR